MSIAVGIKCQNGLVVCADREMANADYKYYEAKILGFPLARGSFFLAQSATDVDDMPRLYERLVARLKDFSKYLTR